MYYTVIKHDGHLKTRRKCSSQMSGVFSNVRCVLSQCKTRLRLFHLVYDMWLKTIKRGFFMSYTPTKHGFLTNQSARRVLSILGNFRFEYEYEMEYENDFSILVCRLHIKYHNTYPFHPTNYPLCLTPT